MKLTLNENIMLFRYYNEEEFFVEVIIDIKENMIGFYIGRSDIGIINYAFGVPIDEKIDFNNQNEVRTFIEKQLEVFDNALSERIEHFDEEYNF